MPATHSLDDLKHYHEQAIQFFGSELLLLKEAIPKINDSRLKKPATLLMSCGQTGAALLQLTSQIDSFTSESVMLARAFIEKLTNFCYVGICDEKEYRAFLLHPIYKHYHNSGFPKMEDGLDPTNNNRVDERKQKQEELKKKPIVQEALSIFSETKPYLNWTNKSLTKRIEVIEQSNKLLDVFFTISNIEYYSDASEALHGSLYGCTYGLGVFDPDFDHTNKEELEKKLYKDSSCVLLHLGMLAHEALTLISYSNEVDDIWGHSYKNRGQALNLLFHVLGVMPNATTNKILQDKSE